MSDFQLMCSKVKNIPTYTVLKTAEVQSKDEYVCSYGFVGENLRSRILFRRVLATYLDPKLPFLCA